MTVGIAGGLFLFGFESINIARHKKQMPYFFTRRVGEHAEQCAGMDEQYAEKINPVKQSTLPFFSEELPSAPPEPISVEEYWGVYAQTKREAFRCMKFVQTSI